MSFSLRNPDLHSVQFPAPGPEHVCLQDKCTWHAGGREGFEVGAKLFETFSEPQELQLHHKVLRCPTLKFEATQNHVPLQRYFPGVLIRIQYVPSLHKEETLPGIHSCLRGDWISMTFT